MIMKYVELQTSAVSRSANVWKGSDQYFDTVLTANSASQHLSASRECSESGPHPVGLRQQTIKRDLYGNPSRFAASQLQREA